jgi:hypothetical protein
MRPGVASLLVPFLFDCGGDAFAQPPPLRSVAPLGQIEAIPGRLRVRVFEYILFVEGRRTPSWLYASDGFRRQGRRELVLFVLRRAKESAKAYPEDPARLLAALFVKGSLGESFSDGDCASLALGRFLGRDDVTGVIFSQLDPLRSVVVQPDALLVVPLVADEIDVALRFGSLRVLGLLGTHHRVFPWPAFLDRDRPAVTPAPGWWDSVLARTTVSRIRGVRVSAEVPASLSPRIGQGNVVVSVAAASRSALVEAVAGVDGAAPAPVALTSELDPEADSLAVYPPRLKTLVPLRSREGPVERLAGTFVAFLPGEEDVASQREDGFVVELTGASRAALHEALREGRDLQILGAPQSMAIRIRWRD